LAAIDIPSEGESILNIASPKYSNNTNTVKQSAMSDQSSVTAGNQTDEEFCSSPLWLKAPPPICRSGKHGSVGWRGIVQQSLVGKMVTRLNTSARDFMDSMSTACRMAPW
jgi:hypothetical protein